MTDVLTVCKLPGTADAYLTDMTIKRCGDDIDIRIYTDGDMMRLVLGLSEYIINTNEDNMLLDLINKKCTEFSQKEKDEILNNINIEKNDKHCYIRRRNLIARGLRDYFREGARLDFDGFLLFRMREYIKELAALVDNGIEEFIIAQEYKEFIDLLKLFVKENKKRQPLVHIVPEYNTYKLFDKSHEEIKITDAALLELNKDDLLISTLITLAPKTVIVHKAYMICDKIRKTIEQIFAPCVVYS